MLYEFMTDMSKTEILLLEFFKGKGEECSYTYSELAKIINVQNSTVSQNLKYLRLRGFIEIVCLGTNKPHSTEKLYKFRLTEKYKLSKINKILELHGE